MKLLDVRRFAGKTTVVTGHFGSGKTNFSVNLSAALSDGTDVYLVDYDNINPYLRALDAKDALRGKNVSVIASVFANTNVDIPSVPSDILGALNKVSAGASAVLDVGGDMLGAVSLGYIHDKIVSRPYETIYVFNAYRPLTATPWDAYGVMREIEAVCGLKISYLVNNSNIGAATTLRDIEITEEYAEKLSEISGVPLLCTCVMLNEMPAMKGEIFQMINYTKQIF